ncbi:MAG: LptF/LptG family permease [Planctomycetota bacterium]|nr:LptF/LptG family permease [Planctomycetota bacterium]
METRVLSDPAAPTVPVAEQFSARTTFFKPRLRTWLPFGLRRLDWYYSIAFLRIFILLLVALMALVTIGDLFQRFDDFVVLGREENLGFYEIAILFARFYGSFVPSLIFQFMFPFAVVVAAGITVTASFAGPRGNNEFTVLRASGIPVKRTLIPLLLPAFIVSAGFFVTRDHFLPAMVRTHTAINNRLKSRYTLPVNISIINTDTFQTAAIGLFTANNIAHNIILEVRDLEKFRRGDVSLGDNDFLAYRASHARLEPSRSGSGWQWMPLQNAEIQTFTRFSRWSGEWRDPVATRITPAMIERQTMGDSVCSWKDLEILAEDYAGARFEMHWRLADPAACCILVVFGFSICMGRMLRGRGASYIHTVATLVFIAGIFYGLRLVGRGMWESGTLIPTAGVWYPLTAATVLALILLVWMER